MKQIALLFLTFCFLSLSACPKAPVKPQESLPPLVMAKFEVVPLKTLTGHRGYLYFAAFSGNGKYLATGSADQSVRIWSIPQWKEDTVLSEHFNQLWGIPVQFSFDSKYLASGAFDQLRIYDVEASFKPLASRSLHKNGIQSIAFSPDNLYIATAGADAKIQVSRVPSLEAVTNIQGHESEIWSVHISPDSKTLVSGGEDGKIKVFRFPSMELLNTVSYHTLPVEYVRFSHNGNLILAASSDGSISVWKTGSYQTPYRVLKGHMGSVLTAEFTIDDRMIISGGDDDCINIYDVEKGELLHQIKDHFGDVMTIAIYPKATYFASGSRDRTVKIWKYSFGQ